MKSIFSLIWLVPLLLSNSGYSQNLKSEQSIKSYLPEFVVEFREGTALNRLEWAPVWTTLDAVGREELARLRYEDADFLTLTNDLADELVELELIERVSRFKQEHDRIESVRYTLIIEKGGLIPFNFERVNLKVRVSFTLKYVQGAEAPQSYRVPASWLALFDQFGSLSNAIFIYDSDQDRPSASVLADLPEVLWREQLVKEIDWKNAKKDKIEKRQAIRKDLENSPIFEQLRNAHDDPIVRKSK